MAIFVESRQLQCVWQSFNAVFFFSVQKPCVLLKYDFANAYRAIQTFLCARSIQNIHFEIIRSKLHLLRSKKLICTPLIISNEYGALTQYTNSAQYI